MKRTQAKTETHRMSNGKMAPPADIDGFHHLLLFAPQLLDLEDRIELHRHKANGTNQGNKANNDPSYASEHLAAT
ncbi:hypothetical protein M3J09_004968 [Ascochyta lentis]